MLFGPDGKTITKMTWKKFVEYQRWDEFPERADNPPMTVDFEFWYKEKKYYCTEEEFGFVIVDENWNRLAYDKNFLNLLEMPVLEGESFKERIGEILFTE